MIVLLPVCAKDADAALRNLAWIRELDGQAPFHCIVSRDSSFDAKPVIEAARLAFATVSEFVYPPPKPLPWPQPQNVAFQAAALHVFTAIRQPWLWWEQDAVPIRKGWLGAIAAGHVAAGKPFFGALCTLRGSNHLTGIAVYPPNVPQLAPNMMLAGRAPFDAVCAEGVLKRAAITELIQVNNTGEPVRWETPEDLERIKPATVLYHRCKDGSLIASLRGRKPAPKQRLPRFAGFGRVQASPVSDVTVVITNFQRADMLWEAFQSTQRASVAHVVISSSGETSQVREVHDRIRSQAAHVKISSRKDDAGCNEGWLRGARLVQTKRMTILHDDDRLLPAYENVVSGRWKADVIHWDGAKHGPGGTIPGCYVTREDLPQGVHPISYLFSLLLAPRAFTLSPVCGCFPTDHVVRTLEECENNFGDWAQLRPGMMVGNDILLWLRACQKYQTVYYSHEPSVSYGHWVGSVTFDDVSNKRMKLLPIYKATRAYFLSSCPRLLHVMERYLPGDAAVARVRSAEPTWEVGYNLGLVVPAHQWIWKRDSTSVCDPKAAPFLKDVLRQALEQTDRDYIVLTNDDTLVNQYFWFAAFNWLKSHGAGCSFRRNVKQAAEMNPHRYPSPPLGQPHCGRDAFFFTREWLVKHLDELPDYLLGYGDWDSTLAMLIRLAAGVKPKAEEFLSEDPSSEIPGGLIYHASHDAEWAETLDKPGQRYNRELTNAFFAKRLGWPMPKLRGSW